jgi:hypothetical protein
MLLLLFACHPAPADSAQDPGCVADYTDALGPDPDFSSPNGSFDVTQYTKSSRFEGAVADGPPVDAHHESARSGACRLVTYEPSSCAPACVQALCVDGSCVAYPTRTSAGRLTLTHDGTVETLEPDKTLSYYGEIPMRVAGELSLASDTFALATCAVTEPLPEDDWSLAVATRAPGEDLTLRWSDPDPTARIDLRMTTGVATHGGIAHAEIECEAPDIGELTIDGTFLDELYREGWSCGECGTNWVYRYRAGGTAELRFAVRSGTYFFYIP